MDDLVRNLLANKKYFLFDLDGTLVDSAKLHALAFNAVLNKYGIRDFDYAKYEGMKTFDVMYLLLKDIVDNDKIILEKLTKQKQSYYLESIDSNLELFPLVLDFLTEYQKGKNFALVTSGSRKNVNRIIRKFNWNNLFDFILTGDDISKGKPSPEIYFQAIQKINYPIDDIVVFEDAMQGVQSAIKANLDVIVVNNLETKSKFSSLPFISFK